MNKILLILSLFLFANSNGQTRLEYSQKDSICKHGKKYDKPERLSINFPFINVLSDYKEKELHKAIPDSFNNDDDWEHPERWWYYHYYFGLEHLLDYDPLGDSVIELQNEPLFYILNETYFFDMNGDSLLDFIHYPKYYKVFQLDHDAYEIFIQKKNGAYKIISFRGFITDIVFNKDGTLNKMTTYQGPCCNDDQCTFYYYIFNKTLNELTISNTEQIFTCQLKKK